MLLNVCKSLINDNFVLSNVSSHQIVRWRRKPRWLPVAKSKQFRVPPRTNTPENERRELFRLQTNYNTELRAVRHFLINEYAAGQLVEDESQIQSEFEKDFAKCNTLNDQWNASILPIRERRIAVEKKLQEEEILQSIAMREQTTEKWQIRADKIVRAEKERAASYITAENINDAIEQALAVTVDYNYAIDAGGQIVKNTDEPSTKKTSHAPTE